MLKCERKVVRKFALEMEKLMHSLCPTNIAKKLVVTLMWHNFPVKYR